MSKKQFEPGQEVEVKRDTGVRTVWEPATYVSAIEDMHGWHRVELPVGKERTIDRLTGTDCSPDHPNAAKTRFLIVPSQRINDSVQSDTKPRLLSKKPGIYKFKLNWCQNTYIVVVTTNLGGDCFLHSLRRQDGKRETRHGQTRQRIREVVFPYVRRLLKKEMAK